MKVSILGWSTSTSSRTSAKPNLTLDCGFKQGTIGCGTFNLWHVVSNQDRTIIGSQLHHDTSILDQMDFFVGCRVLDIISPTMIRGLLMVGKDKAKMRSVITERLLKQLQDSNRRTGFGGTGNGGCVGGRGGGRKREEGNGGERHNHLIFGILLTEIALLTLSGPSHHELSLISLLDELLRVVVAFFLGKAAYYVLGFALKISFKLLGSTMKTCFKFLLLTVQISINLVLGTLAVYCGLEIYTAEVHDRRNSQVRDHWRKFKESCGLEIYVTGKRQKSHDTRNSPVRVYWRKLEETVFDFCDIAKTDNIK